MLHNFISFLLFFFYSNCIKEIILLC